MRGINTQFRHEYDQFSPLGGTSIFRHELTNYFQPNWWKRRGHLLPIRWHNNCFQRYIIFFNKKSTARRYIYMMGIWWWWWCILCKTFVMGENFKFQFYIYRIQFPNFWLQWSISFVWKVLFNRIFMPSTLQNWYYIYNM